MAVSLPFHYLFIAFSPNAKFTLAVLMKLTLQTTKRIFHAAILGAYRLTALNLDKVNGKCGEPNNNYFMYVMYVTCESSAAPATVKCVAYKYIEARYRPKKLAFIRMERRASLECTSLKTLVYCHLYRIY